VTALVQTGALGTILNAATETTTLTGVTAGNALLHVVPYIQDTSFTVPALDATAVSAGWTVLYAPAPITSIGSSSRNTGIAIFLLMNAPSGSNAVKVNFAGSTTRAKPFTLEASGVATVGAADQKAVNPVTTSASTNTVTSGATTQATEFALAIVTASSLTGNGALGISAPPSGWTNITSFQDTNTYPAFDAAYKALTSTGTQSATWTWSTAGESTGVIVTLGSVAPSAPVLSLATASSITDTTASVGATTDTANGTMYAVVIPSAGTTPSAAQIIAGQDSTGTAAPHGSLAISSSGAKLIPITGLTASTGYKQCDIHVGTGGNSNIVTSTFTTNATAPNISSVSSVTPAHQSTLTATGTGFGATQSTGTDVLGGTTQSVTAWGATSVSATVDRGSNAYGVAVNLVITGATNGASNSFALTGLQPQSGWACVNLGTPNTTAANRITAAGDLASGDQLAYDTKGGLVTVNPDGTFSADSSVVSFGCEVWTSGSGWGTTGLQTLSAASTAAPIIVNW
jgi:hypothetical protein